MQWYASDFSIPAQRNAHMGTLINTCSKRGGGLLIAALAVACSALPARATNPPVKAWQWTAPYTDPLNNAPWVNAENWLYQVVSVSDGGHVAAGWTLRTDGTLWPSAVKTDANGLELWNVVFTQTDGTHSGGRAFDVVEVTDGYVIAYGSGNGVSASVGLVKVDKNTGVFLTGFPKWYDSGNLTGYPASQGPTAQSIEVIYSAGVAQGYIVGGNSQAYPYVNFESNMRGAFLMRLDLNFNLVTTFGTSGYTIKNRGFGSMSILQEKSNVFDIKVLYDNNNPATGLPVGILGIGSCMGGTLFSTDRDAFILRTNMNGATGVANTFINTYSEGQPSTSDFSLTSYGYTDVGAPEFRICQTTVSTETNNHERGHTALQSSLTEEIGRAHV